jgi:hypothetical protein
MYEAIRPKRMALESKYMCTPSPIRPRLLVHTPYMTSTDANERLSSRKKKTLRVARLCSTVRTKPCTVPHTAKRRRSSLPLAPLVVPWAVAAAYNGSTGEGVDPGHIVATFI